MILPLMSKLINGIDIYILSQFVCMHRSSTHHKKEKVINKLRLINSVNVLTFKQALESSGYDAH